MKTEIKKEFTVTITLTPEEADVISDALAKGYSEMAKKLKEAGKPYYNELLAVRTLRDTVAGLINRAYMGIE